MIHRPARPSPHMAAEADAWAIVLVRRRFVHAMVRLPSGQWLLQHKPEGPVRLLTGPADVLDLAATVQHHLRTTRPDFR